MRPLLLFFAIIQVVVAAPLSEYGIDRVLNSYGTYATCEVYKDVEDVASLGFSYVILYTYNNGNPAIQNMETAIHKRNVILTNINYCRNAGLGVIIEIESPEQAEFLCGAFTSESNIIGWLVADEVDYKEDDWPISTQNAIVDAIREHDAKGLPVFGSSNYRDAFFKHNLSDKYDYIFLSNYLNDNLNWEGDPHNFFNIHNINYIAWQYGTPHFSVGGIYGLDKCIPAFETYWEEKADPRIQYSLDSEELLNILKIKRRTYGKPGAMFIYDAGTRIIDNDTVPIIHSTIKGCNPTVLGCDTSDATGKTCDSTCHLIRNTITQFFNEEPNNSEPMLVTKSIDRYYAPINDVQMYGNGDQIVDGIKDEYLVGDWDGDGRDNIAVRRNNTIYMDTDFDGAANITLSFGSGDSIVNGLKDEYLVGDWDGDGRDNIAVRRHYTIYMDTDFDTDTNIIQNYGNGDMVYQGIKDEYLVGDWDGDGRDNIAVRRHYTIHMDTDFNGAANIVQSYGNGDMIYEGIKDEYLVGNWNGDSVDNIAVKRGNKIVASIDLDGVGDLEIEYGDENCQYLVGDWNGDGRDNVAFRKDYTIYKGSEVHKKWLRGPIELNSYGEWLSVNDSIVIDLGKELEYVYLRIEFDSRIPGNFEMTAIDPNNGSSTPLVYSFQGESDALIKSFWITNVNSRYLKIKSPNSSEDYLKIRYLGFAGFESVYDLLN